MDTEATQPEETQEQLETPAAEEPEAKETPEGEESPPAEVEANADGEEEESEGEGEEESPAEGTPKAGQHRRKSGFQRKMERQERRIAELEARLAYQGQPQTPAAPPAPAKDKTPEEKAHEAIMGMVQHGVQAELARREQETTVRQMETKWEEQISQDEERGYEVRQFLAGAKAAMKPGVLRDTLLTSEVAPKIISSLLRNPLELARLDALPEAQAARELLRLEQKFASGVAPVKPKSATRPQVPPTSVAGSAASTRNLDDLPLKEYKAAMRRGGR